MAAMPSHSANPQDNYCKSGSADALLTLVFLTCFSMSSYSADISSNSSLIFDDGSQSPISWSRLISPRSSFSGSLLPSKHNVKPELISDATSRPAPKPEVINISSDSESEDQESHVGTTSEAQLPFKKRKLTCEAESNSWARPNP
ncbi:hypothetical protein L1987_77615 [Smallanthus sonchifolius]|uniref:Uncharacterized protein n=1 Tax=Smallanthus sonchifolius TaxID=185202 RepID=A0ACB8ZAN0_9ASTR|nr:hypothetical protein L1987_77615 [Smallanthus sonchifolius]